MSNNRNHLSELETNILFEQATSCDTVEELKEEILPLIRTIKEAWGKKISEIIKETGYTQGKFAELCKVSRMSVSSWTNGSIPKSRDIFIRIGIVANYKENQINRLLTDYGRYPELYSKNVEDCICRFVVTKYNGEEAIHKYDYILSEVKKNIIRDDKDIAEDIDTDKFDRKFSEVKEEDDLWKFIEVNRSAFASAYNKLNGELNDLVDSLVRITKTGSVKDLAITEGWSSSLEQCVSAIRNRKWYPTRNKMISLILHLNILLEEANELLECAHMSHLWPKNPFENIIIFILEDALLNDIVKDIRSEDYDPYALANYAIRILEQLKMSEVEDVILVKEINEFMQEIEGMREEYDVG